MNAFVLILAIAQPSYDGGVGLHSVPFATREACESAAREWNNSAVYSVQSFSANQRGRIVAACHATGVTR